MSWGQERVCKNLPKYIPFPQHDSRVWEIVENELFKKQPKNMKSLVNVMQKISSRTNLDFETLVSGVKYFGEREYFEKIQPFIIGLLKETPTLFGEKLPFLRQFESNSISLTKKQCAVLLSNAWFSTFQFYQDKGEYDHHWSKCFNEFNFWGLFNFESKVQPINEKIKMFLNYFQHLLKYGIGDGKLSITRIYREKQMNEILNSSSPLCDVFLYPKGSISDQPFHRHVDFANMLIGGGVLNCGLVQEETYFVTKTECCVSMLFCPCMTENEVILISGAVEEYCKACGYGWSMKFFCDFKDPHVGQYDMIAMDALSYFAMDSPNRQFERRWIDRDLWKSFLGFQGENLIRQLPISTGKWGCGAFGGNKELKFMEQWISCSAANCKFMSYHTFEQQQIKEKEKGIPHHANEIKEFIEFIKNKNKNKMQITIRDLYNAIVQIQSYAKKNQLDLQSLNVFEVIKKILELNK